MNEMIMKELKNEIYEYIHTNIPASIIEFNHESMTATIQILAKLKIRGQEQIPKEIFSVPVGHNRSSSFAERIPLKKGDIVFVSFSEVSLEKILSTGSPEGTLGSAKFDLSDAVITTCISLEEGKLPAENENDWCVFNLKTNHKIVFKENGELEIFCKKTSINADEEITINSPKINAASSILTVKKAIIAGIDFEKHVHGGIQKGTDKTLKAE
ncbi:MAG: Gp138 family membrane-puncturing spike protein [Cetobacterium sp.]|uniref:Gp138 family membrane-puncturing spike protein n=1 Tax=Cetobacterium sp. TaxID=2071632 RepID=UPI002FC62B7C